MQKIIQFFVGARAELSKVSWPNRTELIRYTFLVVAISFLVALFLGLLDMLFSYLVENILIK